MISCYNAVVRHPHVPRERILRRIMHAQGLDVDVDPSPQEPGSSRDFPESEEDSEDEMGGEEEDMESEPATDDDDAVSVSGSLIKLVFFS